MIFIGSHPTEEDISFIIAVELAIEQEKETEDRGGMHIFVATEVLSNNTVSTLPSQSLH